jgi:glycosyltransferase involved in cell wall biosynthesis
MNIVFDAEDFKNKPRGIVKTTVCLYRACKELLPELRFVGLARKPVAATLPDFIEIVTMRPDMNRSLWRVVMHNMYLAVNGCSAMHFPANGMIPHLFFTENIVLTMHDVIQLTIPGYFSDYGKELRFRRKRQQDINKAAVLITPSEYSKQQIMKHFKTPREPIVIPCAPVLEEKPHDRAVTSAHDGEYFLFNATYDPRKGLPALIDVYYDLWKRKKVSIPLYVAGERSYYSTEFRSLVRDAVAAGAVKECGYVSDEEMVRLLKNARGLIYPSKFEGFGLPPADAMNLGCPVITTPYTSIPEVCGDAALYINPDDGKSFAEAITALERNESLRKELVEKGKRQAQRFSWRKSAGMFLEHVRALCRRDGTRRTD